MADMPRVLTDGFNRLRELPRSTGKAIVSCSKPWSRLRASVDHVVVRMTSCVVHFVAVLLTTSAGRLDRPGTTQTAVTSALPLDDLPRLYLAAGLTGRLTCPFAENPPDSLVVWTKDGRPLDAEPGWQQDPDEDGYSRVRLGRSGTIVFAEASAADEGVYSCLVYSPLHKGPESPPVRVLVRGQ